MLLFNITKCPNVRMSFKILKKFGGVLRSFRSATNGFDGLVDVVHLLFPLNEKNKFGVVDEKICVPNFFCPELFFAEEIFSAAPSAPLRMDLMDMWTWHILFQATL